MHEGVVTVPIPVKSHYRGEIMVPFENTNKHVIATSFDPIIKPIPKDTKVRIIQFDDKVALVSTEMKLAHEPEFLERLERSSIKLINRITPKNKVTGICMICFAQLIGARDGWTCPACNHVAHQYHIMEWIKIKGFCPICRNSLEMKKNRIILVKEKALETSQMIDKSMK